jgi:predicted glycogen debranching enzyme
MSDIGFHRPAWAGNPDRRVDETRGHEWLLANGLGGYASGTVADVMTRKYHGYLIASLPAPLGRMVMLQDLGVSVRLADGSEMAPGGGQTILRDFRLEFGLPVWEYEMNSARLEKRLLMPYGQNTTYAAFTLRGADGALTVRPFIHFRSYEDSVTAPHPDLRVTRVGVGKIDVQGDGGLAPLHLLAASAPWTQEDARVGEIAYHVERDRGYDWRGKVWSPGTFSIPLRDGESATFVASTESWPSFEGITFDDALNSERRRRKELLILAKTVSDATVERLTLAADQFIVTPVGRQEEAARARAAGDETRTVIAGYHWFTDWGRDTMISLEGLTLCTGRHREAGYILRTFAHYVRDGLIPNMFPDGANEGLYHTADATLWFFHALHRYIETTGDRRTLHAILPRLREIIAAHEAGTRFGIGVDPSDGLLTQGAEGYQLTWMDAKVDGWVVTPRRGKAVEINALWYNALRLMATFERSEGAGDEATRLEQLAARTRASFNERFWNEPAGFLFDVVDGEDGKNDPACRPNQIFSMSLDYPVLDESRWPAVLAIVQEKLLTPVGLRSLSPDHPHYKSKYFGDLRARDAAYHQGTVWAWLIGPFVDAYLRVHVSDVAEARGFLHGLVTHLDDFGVGTVAEIFDAESPFTPRGCIAQAWSVAELLRAWSRTCPP